MSKSFRANEPISRAAALLRPSYVREGKPFPLGATWDGLGVNFALFSAHATKVELCLFDDTGERELERIELPEPTLTSLISSFRTCLTEGIGWL